MKKGLLVLVAVLGLTWAYTAQAETYEKVDNNLVVNAVPYTKAEIVVKIAELRAEKNVEGGRRNSINNKVSKLLARKAVINTKIDVFNDEIALWVARKDMCDELEITKIKTDIKFVGIE